MGRCCSCQRILVAFVSYAHNDDEYDAGAITDFASRLQGALRAFTGKNDLEVFFDRTSIKWGDAWRDCIAEGLTDSAILILFLTPNYLSSSECRKEVEDFLTPAGRERWLLPIHYIEVSDLHVRDDPVSRKVRSKQLEDWLELRTVDRKSRKVRKAIEELAKRSATCSKLRSCRSTRVSQLSQWKPRMNTVLNRQAQRLKEVTGSTSC